MWLRIRRYCLRRLMWKIKEKLQMVCDDEGLVRKYKSEASEYICNRYNWEDVVSRTLDVYRRKKNCKENVIG